MSAPFRYSGGWLDRAASSRRDAARLAALRAHPAARVVPVWRDLSLVVPAACGEGGAPCAGWYPAGGDAASAADDPAVWVFLGLEPDGAPVFAADASALDGEPLAALAARAGPGAAFVELRRVGALVSPSDAALMAYARGMLGWHRRHRCCGSCGQATVSGDGGHVRRCANDACRVESYPRTDPAVIMLVERVPADGGPRQCLLGRQGRFAPGMYSTLAGFVEPGESLEEAVAREVFEEAGVRVSRVTYQGSQPWPFPSSLMVGFRALAETDALTVDPDELEDARWFTAAEVAAFGEAGDGEARFRLPGRDSIARALVDAWLAEAGEAGAAG